jgi:ABC-2 type transport system permease protein
VSLGDDLRVIQAVALKDIRSALTERTFTILSIIMPLNFLLLFILFVLSGGLAPIAVVLADRGPLAQQLLSAMAHANSFEIQQTSAAQAQALMRQGKIVAIVTIPASFDARLAAGQPVALPVEVNNLNTDFTNDIRRAVPLAITSFYAHAYPNQVVVQAREIDQYPQDTGYVAYLAVSIVVVGIMLGGLLQAGTNAAREYELGTIKELLLSPAPRWAIEAGKIAGALVLNALGTAVALLAVLALGVWPAHWLELLGYTLLLMATFVSLGVLIGTLVHRRQAVVPLSFGLSLPIFFLSGPFGPANWGTPAIATVARLEPVYYAIAVFQHAFHGTRTTPTSLGTDTLILALFTLAAIGASTLTLIRQRSAH